MTAPAPKPRPWVVQLTRITLDGVKTVTPPEQIITDLSDPEAVGDVLLSGYVHEFAGEQLGLDQLRAWVWEPTDHEMGKPPLVTCSPPLGRFTWGEISDRRKINARQLVLRARALDSRHLLADGTGVTADGYTLLLQLPDVEDDDPDDDN